MVLLSALSGIRAPSTLLWQNLATSSPLGVGKHQTSLSPHAKDTVSLSRVHFGVNESDPVTQVDLIKAFDPPYRFTIYDPQGDERLVTPLEALPRLSQSTRVVIGDLHASYLKLLETLVVGNFITMPKQAPAKILKYAAALDGLIEQDTMLDVPHNQAAARELVELLQKEFDTIQWKDASPPRQLVLLGDVIGDRGPLDLVTLNLLETLTTDHPDRILWLASNHDHGVFEHYAFEGKTSLALEDDRGSFLRSLKTTDDPSALKDQYKHFLTQAKVTLYNPEERTWYTHTPVRPDHVKAVIARINANKDRFNLYYGDWDYDNAWIPMGVKAFTEEANEVYQHHIQAGFEGDLVDEDDEIAFRSFIWSHQTVDSQAFQSFRGKGVRHLVHGHTKSTVNSPFSRSRPSAGGDDPGGSTDPNYEIISLDQVVRRGVGAGGNEDQCSLYVESKEPPPRHMQNRTYQPDGPVNV